MKNANWTTREFSEGLLYARIPLPWSLFLFYPPPLFSFVRSRLTWDPAARERGSRAGIDFGRGSACCCREIDRWNSAERARRWGVNDPDSRGRTCVSPRTTDYEWATLWRSRSANSTHEKVRATEKERWRGGGRGAARERASTCDRSDRERRREHRLRGLPEWKG